MRQFNLTNANGVTFDLMRKDAFFHDPAGFGFGEQTQTQRIGSAFAVTKQDEEQPAPSGTIAFATYDAFEAFRAFARIGGLVLGYKPVAVWYYLDVTIAIEKAEFKPDTRYLDCPVQFTGLSGWYENLKQYRAEPVEGAGKVYPYTYSYTYAQTLPGVIDVPNGELPSSCKIHILGPCQNPFWALYQNGVRVGTGRVNRTIAQGRKLVINSDPANMEIAEYTTNGTYIANRYGDSDFTTQRILQLPAGQCRFSFTHEGTGNVTAWVEVKKRV